MQGLHSILHGSHVVRANSSELHAPAEGKAAFLQEFMGKALAIFEKRLMALFHHETHANTDFTPLRVRVRGIENHGCIVWVLLELHGQLSAGIVVFLA